MEIRDDLAGVIEQPETSVEYYSRQMLMYISLSTHTRQAPTLLNNQKSNNGCPLIPQYHILRPSNHQVPSRVFELPKGSGSLRLRLFQDPLTYHKEEYLLHWFIPEQL
jgi:hypothetical protein